MTALLLSLLALGTPPDVDPPSRLFDPDRCGLVRTVAPLGGDILALSFSLDGGRLAAGCGNTVRVYDTRTWKEVRKLEGHPEPVMGVALRGDGRVAAAGGFAGTILMWDVETGEVRSRLKGHTTYVSVLAFSPDGKTLLSGGHDGTVRRWNADLGDPIGVLAPGQGRITSLAFSRDGRNAATAGSNGKIKVWDTRTWKETRTVTGAWGAKAVAFSRDGRSLTVAELQGIRVCALDDEKARDKVLASVGAVNGAAFMPDNRFLVYGGSEGEARVWDLQRARVAARLAHHTGAINAVAVAPHGRIFVTAGMDRHLKVWGRVPTGKARLRAKGFCGIRVRQAPGGGVTVAEVVAGSAAERDGLKFNDKITKIGGVPVANPIESVDKISSYFAGDVVEFSIRRDGKERTVRVTLGKRPPDVP